MGFLRWVLVLAVLAKGPLLAQGSPAPDGGSGEPRRLSADETRRLLAVRDQVWRAWFANDTATLSRTIPPELIAIQEFQEPWERRDQLLADSKTFHEGGGRLIRLDFPHTEIQCFGAAAILYYTYQYESEFKGVRYASAGRGTEVFVLRNGQWVDEGWHLDNGPKPPSASPAPPS